VSYGHVRPAAADFFVVPTATYRLLFVPVILHTTAAERSPKRRPETLLWAPL